MQNCGNCKRLDSSRRYAWKMYYQILEHEFELSQAHAQLMRQFQEIESKNDFILPPHFKDEMIQCLKELECPICLETMTKETFNYTKCFHKICKKCVDQIKTTTKQCPICRNQLK